LRDALTNPDRIDNLFVASASEEISENLCLLSTEEPLDNPIVVKPDAVDCLLKELCRNFDRVILDVPCRHLHLLCQALVHANSLIVVSDFSLAGLRDAGRILTLAKDTAPRAKRLVVGNRSGGAKGEISGDQIEKSLGSTLSAIIPEDDSAVLNALNTGEPLLKSAPGSRAAKALHTFAAIFSEKVPAAPSFFARILGVQKAGVE
jgi:pilus assembly protein CpaE